MTPRQIATKQIEAYNQLNLDAFCALFSSDAVLTDLPSGQVLASGLIQIREMYQARFAQANLSCRVHTHMDIGDFAIDRETIYCDSAGPVDVVAMYEVKNDLIHRVFFIREEAPLPSFQNQSMQG